MSGSQDVAVHRVPSGESHLAVERVARESYGRLVAIICRKTNDLAAAEDALASALLTALETWSQSGLPVDPEAWLIRVAQRKWLDETRHSQLRDRVLREVISPVLALLQEKSAMHSSEDPLQDDRLAMMFACAHPAIEPSMRTPLILQAVLGIDAGRIASAFLINPQTMSQRLVRVKNKLKVAKIPFELPPEHQWQDRLDDVLSAIYAAYGTAFDETMSGQSGTRALAREAIWLAHVVQKTLPQSAEAAGLYALLLFCEARRNARRGIDGQYVPLLEQSPELWDGRMLDEAEAILSAAFQQQAPGRFQWEAAIQSAHCARRHLTKEHGFVDWPAIAVLYEGLLSFAPSLGARVAQVGALLQANQIELAKERFALIPREACRTYQPWWVVSAELARRQGQNSQAHSDLMIAMGLTEDSAVKAFLARKAASLEF